MTTAHASLLHTSRLDSTQSVPQLIGWLAHNECLLPRQEEIADCQSLEQLQRLELFAEVDFSQKTWAEQLQEDWLSRLAQQLDNNSLFAGFLWTQRWQVLLRASIRRQLVVAAPQIASSVLAPALSNWRVRELLQHCVAGVQVDVAGVLHVVKQINKQYIADHDRGILGSIEDQVDQFLCALELQSYSPSLSAGARAWLLLRALESWTMQQRRREALGLEALAWHEWFAPDIYQAEDLSERHALWHALEDACQGWGESMLDDLDADLATDSAVDSATTAPTVGDSFERAYEQLYTQSVFTQYSELQLPAFVFRLQRSIQAARHKLVVWEVADEDAGQGAYQKTGKNIGKSTSESAANLASKSEFSQSTSGNQYLYILAAPGTARVFALIGAREFAITTQFDIAQAAEFFESHTQQIGAIVYEENIAREYPRDIERIRELEVPMLQLSASNSTLEQLTERALGMKLEQLAVTHS